MPTFDFIPDAWRKVTTADPLADSDDDGGGDDEHARYEYSKLLCMFLLLVVDVVISVQRLRVLAGFLGTPSSEN